MPPISGHQPECSTFRRSADDRAGRSVCRCPAGQASFLADHRYGFDIVCAALADGLAVQDAETGRFAHLPEENAA